MEIRNQNESLVSGAIEEVWSQFVNEEHSEKDRILEALFQEYRSEILPDIGLTSAFTRRIGNNNKLEYINQDIPHREHLLSDLIQREDEKTSGMLIWRLELSLRYLESNPDEYERVKDFVDKEILPYKIGGSYVVPYYEHPGEKPTFNRDIPLNFDLYVFDLLCQGEEFPKCFQERILKDESEKLWEHEWGRWSVPDIAFRLAQMKQRIPPSIESTLNPGMHSSEMAIKQFRQMLLQSVIEVDVKFIPSFSKTVRNIEYFLGPRGDLKLSPQQELDDILECIVGIKKLKTIFETDTSVVNSMDALLDISNPKDEPKTLTKKQTQCFKLLLDHPEGMSNDDIQNHVGGRPTPSLEKLLEDGHVIKNGILWQPDPCYLPKFIPYILDKKYTEKDLVDTLIKHFDKIESPKKYLDRAFEIYDKIGRPDHYKGKTIELIALRMRAFFEKLDYDNEKDEITSLDKKKLVDLRSLLLFQENEYNLGWPHNKHLLDYILEWTSYCIEYNVDSDLGHLGYDTLQDRYINVKGDDKKNEILNYQNYLSESTRMLIEGQDN